MGVAFIEGPVRLVELESLLPIQTTLSAFPKSFFCIGRRVQNGLRILHLNNAFGISVEFWTAPGLVLSLIPDLQLVLACHSHTSNVEPSHSDHHLDVSASSGRHFVLSCTQSARPSLEQNRDAQVSAQGKTTSSLAGWYVRRRASPWAALPISSNYACLH